MLTGLTILERDYLGLLKQFTRLLRDRVLAEDLVNDAVAEALVKLREQMIDEPERITGFIHAVAINRLRNHRRRLCNRCEVRATPAVLDQLSTSSDPTEALDHGQLVSRVLDVIDELPTERDREVMRRFYLDEEEKSSICADLHLSPTHFDKVAFRARQRMRALLAAARRTDMQRTAVTRH
jgi:RNA polymerase sigma-70 factor (ECF subfamily)